MVKVDLHLHTTHSDGTLTPRQLLQSCVDRGLKVVAITDHDSTEGLAEATEAGSEFGVKVISGIELSTDVPGSEIHMLGYFINPNDVQFQTILSNFREGRRNRAREMVKKLNAIGVSITWEHVSQIAGEAAVGRPHIAQAIVDKGYVAYKKEAFDRYLGRNGLAYVERPRLKPTEAISLLLDNGAAPVMAHPLYYEQDSSKLRSTISELKEAGMVGIEVEYGEFSNIDRKLLASIADEFNLLHCGGSDYHASGNPGEAQLGSAGPTLETVAKLESMTKLRQVPIIQN